jgi:transcriptional regulator with XRE-family HTH domain
MELRKYRRILGLTQEELGAKAGVDPTVISRLETGKSASATYENIVRLARALNLEPEELFPVILQPPPPGADDADAKGAA